MDYKETTGSKKDHKVLCCVSQVSYPSVPAPDLPFERVSDHPPFIYTGLDFVGPLFACKSNGSEMKVMGKVYICLFTCASTRGIHLELTRGLDVDSFLLALRRFSAQRGLPATLFSDNANTFRAASKEVKKIARSEEVLHYLTEQRISWKFIVEKAPWWGGFWERVVQSVKRSLRKAIGSASLSFEEIRTLLVEVESVINAFDL